MKTDVWESIRRKSACDRMFFDNLTLLVWCECKEGNSRTKSSSSDNGCDIQLPCWSAGGGAWTDEALGINFNTPRRKLSRRELTAVQEFISGHTFRSVTDAREQMRPWFGDCITSALNVISEFGTDRMEGARLWL